MTPRHMNPVNPDASREARDLLRRLYDVEARRQTLSGQHNQMFHMSEPSEKVEELTGVYPAVWGGEWGFSDADYKIDDIALRPKVLDEVRRHHAMGSILVLTYHQASPTVGEPCGFNPGVILDLTEQEYEAVLTPGSSLHTVWAEHVDRLAAALAELGRDGVPVILRPYHEMSGSWFWWGGDSARFLRLWGQLFDRFTKQHGLNNLLWAWNPDRPWPNVAEFFPGHETVDVLGADIYPLDGQPEVFPQEWYDRMRALAGDKPLALSEHSVLPDAATLERQPWCYFMAWDNMLFRANDPGAIVEAYANPGVVSLRR